MFRLLSCRGVLTLLLPVACLMERAGADEPKKDPPSAEQIAGWVRDLGDEDFNTRENASKRLWQAGRLAAPALKKALNSEDAEVIRRCRELLDKFQWGIYPDTPAEIVALIQRYQSGVDVRGKATLLMEILDEGCDGRAALARIKTGEDSDTFELVQSTAAVSFGTRAHQRCKQKDYDLAIKDYDEALRLDPGYGLALNNKAWLLAVCPDEQYRDGKQAVELATRACEVSKWKSGRDLDTLAAAYAETGDFEKALAYQEKALEDESTVSNHENEMREHLKLFKEKMPIRQLWSNDEEQRRRLPK